MLGTILRVLTSAFLPKVGSLLSLIGKHWKVLLGITIICAGAFYVWDLNRTIQTLQDKNFQLAHDHAVLIERCNTNRLELEQAIAKQNEKIQDLNSDLKSKSDKINKIIKKNEQIKKEHEEELLSLFQEKTPKTCEESIKYLINGKDDLTW